MAQRLVDTLAADWRPARHRDRYTADVLALIRCKAKGEEIEAPEPEAREAPDDLSAALEASLSGGGRRRRARGAQHSRRAAGRARARGNGHSRRAKR